MLEGDPDTPAVPGLKPHVILSAAGEQVGVFGLTTADLPHIVTPASLEGVRVRDPVEVAKEQVEILSPQVDVIVALTHIGLESDLDLAAQVDGIDLIVGGHSHTAMEAAEEVGLPGSYNQDNMLEMSEWRWHHQKRMEIGNGAALTSHKLVRRRQQVTDLVATWSDKVRNGSRVPSESWLGR